VRLETVVADMREIPSVNQFDAIVNMYSSFGYLESETEDLRVLESAARALKQRGQLLLDMLNREWAVANYIQNDWHKDRTARCTSSVAILTWPAAACVSVLRSSAPTDGGVIRSGIISGSTRLRRLLVFCNAWAER